MTTSLASKCDLKSSMGGEIGLFVVRVPSFMLAASIVVVGSMLGFVVVGVVNVASTSPAPTIGALGWPLCSRARFWLRNSLRAFLGPGDVVTLVGWVSSELLSSSDSSLVILLFFLANWPL
jgi:hypothetical protein